jgi:hypothetical protein
MLQAILGTYNPFMLRDLLVFPTDKYSGGLPTSGSPNENCGSSLGQVYARAAEYNGAFAIM